MTPVRRRRRGPARRATIYDARFAEVRGPYNHRLLGDFHEHTDT